MSTCFVTVGTTKFDRLINEVLSNRSLSALNEIGITRCILQIGSGEWSDEVKERVFEGMADDEGKATNFDITIEYYRYKPSIQQDLENAQLIIGHAGAGTVLECLRLEKPLLVVINQLLMDNHQLELASALADGCHLMYCLPKDLSESIRNPGLFSMLPYKAPDQKRLVRFIDNMMGVAQTR